MGQAYWASCPCIAHQGLGLPSFPPWATSVGDVLENTAVVGIVDTEQCRMGFPPVDPPCSFLAHQAFSFLREEASALHEAA